MSAYPGGHAGFLAAALATHAVVGYTLGALLFDRPMAGVAGGVLADADLLAPAAWGSPFVHRGITHTALAAGVTVAVLAPLHRDVAGAVGAGYASQLLLDATTASGIPLAYPLSGAAVGVDLAGHAPPATVGLWLCCVGLLWLSRRYRGSRDANPD